jgi:hypothetical protein
MLGTIKDAARRLRRWPAAILDGACAWRSASSQVGTKECQPRSNKGMALKEEITSVPTLIEKIQLVRIGVG